MNSRFQQLINCMYLYEAYADKPVGDLISLYNTHMARTHTHSRMSNFTDLV